MINFLLVLIIVMVIGASVCLYIVFKMWDKASGGGIHSGPGVVALYILIAVVLVVIAGFVNKYRNRLLEEAKAKADFVLSETLPPSQEGITQTATEIKARREAAEEAAATAAAEAAQEQDGIIKDDIGLNEDGSLPDVHIDVTTYRYYEKYREPRARRGTRSENAKWKAHIAQCNGYKDTDAVSIPFFMDLEYFNQLNQIYPEEPITYDTLRGINLNDEEACKSALEEQCKLDRAAWNQMKPSERYYRGVEELNRDIINDPVTAIGWFDMLTTEDEIANSYPDLISSIQEVIDRAYSEDKDNPDKPYGVDYFLVYDTKEHAEAELEQYAHVSDEFYREVAVPICQIIRTAFDPSPYFEARMTSMNMYLPPTLLDSHCRLKFAPYQESRMSMMLIPYGKNARERYKFGTNLYDRRPEKFALSTKKEKQSAVTTEKKEQKVQVTETTEESQETTTETTTTPDGGGGGGGGGGGDDKNPGDEPIQSGEGGDVGGGDNVGDEDGGDQNHDSARNDEQQDTAENSGDGNAENTENSGNGNGNANGDGNTTVTDSGGNQEQPEGQDVQNGTGGSLDTVNNTAI